jgi:hypothetical protein
MKINFEKGEIAGCETVFRAEKEGKNIKIAKYLADEPY